MEKGENVFKSISDKDDSGEQSEYEQDSEMEGEEFGEAVEIELGRKDFTKNFTEEQRRLDTLCDLIGTASQCVSISIFQKKLKISSNDFHSGTLEPEANQQLNSIKRITEYFLKISKDKKTDEKENRDIFLEICSVKRFSIRFKMSFSKKLATEIANKVFDKEVSDMAPAEIVRCYGKDAVVAAMMFAEFEHLHNDFSKLRDFLSSQEGSQYFKDGYEILKSDVKEAHAEIQQLALVVKMVEENIEGIKERAPQEIYFGLSKLCCLHCHSMLKAANEIFEKKKVPIKLVVRGWHDLDKSKRKVNTIFEKKLGDRRSKSKDIEDNIGFLIKSRAKEIATDLETHYEEQKSAKRIRQQQTVEEDLDSTTSMYKSLSESESEEEKNKKFLKQKKILQERLDFLSRNQESDLKKIMRKIEISLELHDLELFKTLPQQKLETPDEIESAFYAIFAQINLTKNEKITEEFFKEIVSDPDLVGKEFSDIFILITTPSEQKRKASESRYVAENKKYKQDQLLQISKEKGKEVGSFYESRLTSLPDNIDEPDLFGFSKEGTEKAKQDSLNYKDYNKGGSTSTISSFSDVSIKGQEKGESLLAWAYQQPMQKKLSFTIVVGDIGESHADQLTSNIQDIVQNANVVKGYDNAGRFTQFEITYDGDAGGYLTNLIEAVIASTKEEIAKKSQLKEKK